MLLRCTGAAIHHPGHNMGFDIWVHEDVGRGSAHLLHDLRQGQRIEFRVIARHPTGVSKDVNTRCLCGRCELWVPRAEHDDLLLTFIF